MTKRVEVICKMFGDPCGFCSEESVVQIRPYSVIKDCSLGKKGHVGKKRVTVEFGQFCNNDGKHFVRDMKYCPARFSCRKVWDKVKDSEEVSFPHCLRQTGAVILEAR